MLSFGEGQLLLWLCRQVCVSGCGQRIEDRERIKLLDRIGISIFYFTKPGSECNANAGLDQRSMLKASDDAITKMHRDCWVP